MLHPKFKTAAAHTISDNFMQHARDHLGSKSAADSIVRQCLFSAIEDLDGIDGRLNRSVIIRPIVQNFARLKSRFIHLWGGDISHIPAPIISYREGNDTGLNGNLSSLFPIYSNKIVLFRHQFNQISERVSSDSEYPVNVEIEYSAGIARNLDSLPEDLKTAIFAIARRKYDYRDSYIYENYPEDKWLKKTISKYRYRPIDYPY